MGKSVTITVVANMTSNYSEGIGNAASIQKVYRNQKVYAIRSKESLKNSLCVQSGLYDDLQTDIDGAMQKKVTEEENAATCRALEGGYMSTKGTTMIRKSSFYVSDAVACDSFVSETRFHNNLYLASNYAKAHGTNVQESAKDSGLMPYQYEYDKSLKVYSVTIDLDMVGKDENYNAEADASEKIYRVNALLDAIQYLSLVVKGNLDNAEPVFVVGGLSNRKTHFFENVVNIKEQKLIISQDMEEKLVQGFDAGLLRGGIFKNEQEIESRLNPKSVGEFFNDLKKQVEEYYNA